jgi:hypothetical protein
MIFEDANRKADQSHCVQYAFAIVAFSFCLLLAGPSPAESQEFELQGVVIGIDGSEKSGTHLYFNGPNSYFAVTDENGIFQISQFSEGRYSVKVQENHNSQTFFVNIDHNDRLRFRVRW